MSTRQILEFGDTSNSSSLDEIGGSSYIKAKNRVGSHLNKPSQNKKRVKLSHEKPISESIIHQLQNDKDILDSSIDLILRNEKLKRSYSHLYQIVERTCKFKHIEQSKLADVIYDKIRNAFDIGHLNDVLHDEDAVVGVKKFLDYVNEWIRRLSKLTQVFIYLDRNYLLIHPVKKTILEFGVSLITEHILKEDSESWSLVYKKQESLMDDLRRRNFLEPELCLELTSLLNRLQSSKERDERYFNTTIEYYNSNNTESIEDIMSSLHNEIDFLQKCKKPREFIYDLFTKLRWLLIFSDFNELLSNNFETLLGNPNYLKSLFEYCKFTLRDFGFDSLSVFKYQWEKFCTGEYVSILEANNNLVDQLNTKFEELNHINQTYFDQNERFEFSVRTALKDSISKNQEFNLNAILQLCKYCEVFFKQKIRVGDPDYSQFKSKVLSIYKAFNNKNDFLIPYKRDLSRRLLLNKKVDLEKEEDLISSLIQLTGETEITISLQIMFNDLRKSKEYDQFQNSYNIEFTSLILDQRYWPDIPSTTEINLSGPFKQLLTEFEQHYQSLSPRHENQILNWNNYKLHQLVIEGHFANGNKEIHCNLLQAMILTLFNEHDVYKRSQLSEYLHCEDKLLTNILHSLTEKYAIIITKGDVFYFNVDFQDKATKIKLPPIKDTKSNEVNKVSKIIEANRIEEYKSVIVKLMKQFKSMSMIDLLNSSITELQKKRAVEVQELKKSIETLIELEYLKRENNDTIIYIP